MGEELPSWLDNSFFATILQKRKGREHNVKVTKVSATMAVAAGNNYTSRIYRVKVEFKTEETDSQIEPLIVKVPLTKGVMTEMKDFNVYDIEQKIYNELLPKIKSRTNIEFGPEPFYCSPSGLILRDIKEDGYVMCDKLQQLDYTHCYHVIRVIAKYHAASVACHADDPNLVEAIGQEKFFVESSSAFNELRGWFESCFKYVIDVLNELGACKEFVSYISGRSAHVAASAVNICKPKVKGLNVLNHGDLWVNNMLFKHSDSEEVVDLKLIDFQIPRYASPAVDLLYFIWTSANEQVRKFRLQDLFNTYVLTLNSTLAELDCKDRFSQEELQEDLKSSSDWAVINVCCVLPYMMCDAEYVINMEDVKLEDFKDDDRFRKMYNSKHYRAALPQIANQLHDWILSL